MAVARKPMTEVGVLRCPLCGAEVLSKYKRSTPRLCKVCSDRASEERKKQRRRERRLAELEAMESPACPHSPDCEKCPLPDCRVTTPHKYNVLPMERARWALE